METVIELKEVTKDFGNQNGVFDINLEVRKGEIFGYLGPNGAGKSTTIRQIMGFIKADKGTCTILNKNCFEDANSIQNKVGYLAGEIAFINDMRAKEYINFIADMKKIKDRKRMNELIEMFELETNVKIKKMSKGMKQKVGIVIAFMGNPEVLILDEPTSGLDPLMQNKFVELLLEEKKKGTTIFMSSHMLEEIEKTCDRTAIIRDGKIIDIFDMDELRKMKKKLYIITFNSGKEIEKIKQEESLNIQKIEENKISILVENDLSKILKILSKYEIIDLQIQSQSLEELFLHFYGKECNKND